MKFNFQLYREKDGGDGEKGGEEEEEDLIERAEKDFFASVAADQKEREKVTIFINSIVKNM